MVRLDFENMQLSAEAADVIDTLDIYMTLQEENGSLFCVLTEEDFEKLNEAIPYGDWQVSYF